MATEVILCSRHSSRAFDSGAEFTIGVSLKWVHQQTTCD